ncbi:hypothetical protein [Pararhizobium haloflavum]|uniref:hypothetical protein n=1 Tax=Pararhizobium haloflavum TaxID=2037914 RepID=UPI000C18F639|nr:hypothetical protein [Pararhizobium haloflavum]
MKLCKQCKFFRPRATSIPGDPPIVHGLIRQTVRTEDTDIRDRCEVMGEINDFERSPLTGEPMLIDFSIDALAMRLIGPCGPSGRLFKGEGQ